MLAKSVYVTCRLISVFNYTYIFVVEANGPRCILCNKTLGKGDEASFVTVFWLCIHYEVGSNLWMKQVSGKIGRRVKYLMPTYSPILCALF